MREKVSISINSRKLTEKMLSRLIKFRFEKKCIFLYFSSMITINVHFNWNYYLKLDPDVIRRPWDTMDSWIGSLGIPKESY